MFFIVTLASASPKLTEESDDGSLERSPGEGLLPSGMLVRLDKTEIGINTELEEVERSWGLDHKTARCIPRLGYWQYLNNPPIFIL